MPDVITIKRVLLEAVDKYDRQLAATGAEPQRYQTAAVVPGNQEAHAHLRWICLQAREFAAEGCLECPSSQKGRD